MLYRLILKIRHFLYDKGLKKINRSPRPAICIGNVTVGGTGKTPHTEMIIRILQESFVWSGKTIGVLSRGYKRKSRGFRTVEANGSASIFGDEPLQIKKKFPDTYVAVDKDRLEGCQMMSRISGRRTPADLIILDDAFQHRSLKADLDIVLADYNRPVTEDKLLPFGDLRDLPERIGEADIIIMTKCPHEMDVWERTTAAYKVGIHDYKTSTCEGTGLKGKRQMLFFTTIDYDSPVPVFPDTDNRYMYSKKLVLFTGIAKDGPLRTYLGDRYRLVANFRFRDHHRFRPADFRKIASALKEHPTAAVATTEKDAQRVVDCKKIPQRLRERMFYVPIKVSFLDEEQKRIFTQRIIAL